MGGISLNITISGDLGFVETELDELKERFANEIVTQARRIIDESTPAGRLYRRGAIRGRYRQGLDRIRDKTSRARTGTKIHRASAAGQAPAKDTGKLYREIKVSRTGRGTYRVRFGANYAGFLEFKLNRPFILPAIEAAAKLVFNQ